MSALVSRRRSFALLFLLAACGGSDATATWRALPADAATAAQRQQAERGDAARVALVTALQAELNAAIEAKGAAGAVAVCSTRATALAASIGEQQGVLIGRTSAKLRNTGNVPPAWAAGAVSAAHGEGRDAKPSWFAGPRDELGMLQPIVLQPLCVACHGNPEQLADGVADALLRTYPLDAATGFAPGDLRGWFWVVVPAN